MHRTIWTIVILLVLACANIDANPNLRLQLELPSNPPQIGWVASEYLGSPTSKWLSSEEVMEPFIAGDYSSPRYIKHEIKRSIDSFHENVSVVRPFWSITHRPNYPSEVSRI